MTKKTIFTGSGVAIVTPFNPDGSVNYGVFAELIEEQIEKETDALIVCGTTGEASTLNDDEHIECIRFAVEKVAKRIPIIAGTGSNNTLHMIELSLAAEKSGADALLLMTPYYNKTSQRGLISNFTKVADAVKIPIMLYNIPGRTCVNIEISTFIELAEHPNIVAVKEAGGDINYMAQIIEACGENLGVYSGDDVMTVPAMALGAKGVVSVAANIAPQIMREICRLCLENDFAEAGKLQIKYLKLCMDLLKLDVNPIPVKTALNLMGKNVGGLRMPLFEMEDSASAKLKVSLQSAKLI
ncbi:MAG: 4-hydroxy-tetrahydrodipicolinate synthase [Oscillospiraceae bacterium]|nr:4-hydroxy-tetrahydrodipicolinate synthase [Oscillospiraceae bacterium]